MLGILAATPLQAGEAKEHEAAITDVQTRVRKNELHVSFTLQLGEAPVKTQHKRILTPVIRTADGRQRVSLPPVVLKGRNRAIAERKNHRNEDSNAYRVLTGKQCKNSRVDYQAETPYQPWMEQAVVTLEEQVTGCAECGVLTQEQPMQSYAVYAPRLVQSPQAQCPREFVQRTEQCDAYLIYPVNETRLYPDRYGNRAELAKIDSAITFVQNNPDYEITGIAMAGYASPEGNYDHNVYLAQARAKTLYEYMKVRYNLSDTLMTVATGNENWDGLVEALAHYELPYKEEILRTIGQVDDPDLRDEALKRIGGGMPYQTLLHAIYPTLRKNTCTIAYTSRERSIDVAHRLVFSQPSELNPYEFYNVADSCYKDDPQTYRRILKIAADTYPQHSVANLNAAQACLDEGDLENAARYLEHTDQSPATWNTRACLLWKQGKLEEALVWWRKAAAKGDTQAEHNLAEAGKR